MRPVFIAENASKYTVVLVLIAVFVAMWFLWVAGQFIAVLLHESGHWVAARILGKKDCHIVIGSLNPMPTEVSSGRIICFGIRPWNKGYTSYTPPPLTLTESIWIASAGPLVSGLVTIAGVLLCLFHAIHPLAWVVIGPLWLANVRVLAVSLWPGLLAASSTADGTLSPESDLHYIIRQVKHHRSKSHSGPR